MGCQAAWNYVIAICNLSYWLTHKVNREFSREDSRGQLPGWFLEVGENSPSWNSSLDFCLSFRMDLFQPFLVAKILLGWFCPVLGWISFLLSIRLIENGLQWISPLSSIFCCQRVDFFTLKTKALPNRFILPCIGQSVSSRQEENTGMAWRKEAWIMKLLCIERAAYPPSASCFFFTFFTLMIVPGKARM